jgi:hypothetical protein
MRELNQIEQRRRSLRIVLFIIIVATLPFYCAGILLWGSAPQRNPIGRTPSATRTTQATNTVPVFPSITPFGLLNPTQGLPPTPAQFIPPTTSGGFIFPTFPPLPPTVFIPPIATIAPTLTLYPSETPFIPSETPIPIPTDTLIPTATPTETPTATSEFFAPTDTTIPIGP